MGFDFSNQDLIIGMFLAATDLDLKEHRMFFGSDGSLAYRIFSSDFYLTLNNRTDASIWLTQLGLSSWNNFIQNVQGYLELASIGAEELCFEALDCGNPVKGRNPLKSYSEIDSRVSDQKGSNLPWLGYGMRGFSSFTDVESGIIKFKAFDRYLVDPYSELCAQLSEL
jgi:hypothetical protein